jgi:hypothetical protein
VVVGLEEDELEELMLLEEELLLVLELEELERLLEELMMLLDELLEDETSVVNTHMFIHQGHP